MRIFRCLRLVTSSILMMVILITVNVGRCVADPLFFVSIKSSKFEKFAGKTKIIENFYYSDDQPPLVLNSTVAQLLNGATYIDLSSLGIRFEKLPRVNHNLIFDMGSEKGADGDLSSFVLDNSGNVLYAAILKPGCKQSLGWTCSPTKMTIFLRSDSDRKDALRVFENWRINTTRLLLIPKSQLTSTDYKAVYADTDNWLDRPIEQWKNTQFILLPKYGNKIVGTD